MGFLLPARCVACNSPGWRLCPACAAELSAPPARPPPGGLSSCRSLFRYEGSARQLVVGLKSANRRAVVPLLGGALAAALPPALRLAVGVVTWPPTTAAHRRRRGYDQAELLARSVARRLGCPARPLLRRPRDDRAQSGLGRSDRLVGPSFVARPCGAGFLAARGGVAPDLDVVLLVDDVLTTGGTLSAAATTLLGAGTRQVHAVTVAAVAAAQVGAGVAAPSRSSGLQRRAALG